MQLIARKSFYAGNMIPDYSFIYRGQIFFTTDFHAEQLQRKGLARPVTAGVYGVKPSKTQTLDPEHAPELAPIDPPAAAPVEIKEEPPERQPDHTADAQPEPEDHLEALTVPELKQRAKALGIKGYSEMNKSGLKKAIREKEE